LIFDKAIDKPKLAKKMKKVPVFATN